MNAEFVSELVCVETGERFSAEDVQCEFGRLERIFDVRYDLERVAQSLTAAALAGRVHDIWRYQELLPVDPAGERPGLSVGWTPIVHSERLRKLVGLSRLWVKDDGRNPTASFKDRASAVGAARARQRGADAIACASTGNAASSLAGMAASIGMPAFIFVPERIPQPKLTQLLAFGAKVVRVAGPYENAFELCQQACDRWGWYNRSCAINPYLVEGKKTCGLEIGEQFAADPPDWVVVSVGDGCTIAGVVKGMEEMHQLGFLARVPRVLGVQAAGAAPLKRAFDEGRDLIPSPADTIADSIAVGTPRNWRKALDAVRRVEGQYVAVSDDAILDGISTLARLTGVFAEPAAAASLAGLIEAREQGVVGANESALVVVTGNGLKDVSTVRGALETPIDVPLDLEEAARQLTERGHWHKG